MREAFAAFVAAVGLGTTIVAQVPHLLACEMEFTVRPTCQPTDDSSGDCVKYFDLVPPDDAPNVLFKFYWRKPAKYPEADAARAKAREWPTRFRFTNASFIVETSPPVAPPRPNAPTMARRTHVMIKYWPGFGDVTPFW